MSDEQAQYRSRLQKNQPGPTRGIGSGFAENQAIAGASNPDRAAKIASRSESEAMSTAEKLQEEEQELDNLIEDVVLAHREGVFAIPDAPDVETTTALVRFVQGHSPAIIREWHAQVQGAYDAQVEEEDEVILAARVRNEAAIDPADPLYDPMRDLERRKNIEAALKPLDFEEMVFRGWTTQEVEIRPGFTLTFRTIPTQHGLWLEHFIANTQETSIQHTRHYFSLLQVAAGLDKVNGKMIGPDLAKYVKDDSATRESFNKALEERMEFLGKLPSMLTDDLIIQQVWFNGRVRRLLAGDLMKKVGNS